MTIHFCAWCRLFHDGLMPMEPQPTAPAEPISHGICRPCSAWVKASAKGAAGTSNTKHPTSNIEAERGRECLPAGDRE